MPTITFSLVDLNNLVGKKITEERLVELLNYAKAELERKEGDEITVKFNDTNQPYLWSVEGLAIFFRGVLGLEKGIPKIKIEKSNNKLFVDKSVKTVRPYISAFIAKGVKIDDYLLKQIIQLQEKLCDNYGRRRQKIAIGVYTSKKIEFPVNYKAVDPESVDFVPLDFKESLNLINILEKHPKGKEYAWILKDEKRYPILLDSRKNILSFPPIINSAELGKIKTGDDELFFEATGNDENAIRLATNIFAHALYLRGFKLYSITIEYDNKKIETPDIRTEKIKINKELIKSLIGIELKDKEVKELLEKARYDFDNYSVEIPSFRQDIMHAVDVVEDVAIQYGYNNLESSPLTTYTIGQTFEKTNFVDRIRTIIVGLGFQEVWSSVLSNKKLMNEQMNIENEEKNNMIEIEEYISETYSTVRNWLTPIMLDFLSQNKHNDFPQKIFEQGIVTTKNDKEINDYENISIVTSQPNTDFTEIKQVLDYIMKLLNLTYQLDETEHNSFISGRIGKIIVNKTEIGLIGEISPKILFNFHLENPVAALELNLTKLFELVK